MGYFQNKYENWVDYADINNIERICDVCGNSFTPISPNQKRHSYLSFIEYGDTCFLEDEINRMSPKRYLKHIGLTKEEFISAYGIENYNDIVIKNK